MLALAGKVLGGAAGAAALGYCGKKTCDAMIKGAKPCCTTLARVSVLAFGAITMFGLSSYANFLFHRDCESATESFHCFSLRANGVFAHIFGTGGLLCAGSEFISPGICTPSNPQS